MRLENSLSYIKLWQDAETGHHVALPFSFNLSDENYPQKEEKHQIIIKK